MTKNNIYESNEIAGSIYLSSVKKDNKSGVVDVTIGGIMDNLVGYLYIPDGASVPEMSAAHYIYLEHIIDNWYIYKTT